MMTREYVKQRFLERLQKYGDNLPIGDEQKAFDRKLYDEAFEYYKTICRPMTKKEQKQEYAAITWLCFNTSQYHDDEKDQAEWIMRRLEGYASLINKGSYY